VIAQYHCELAEREVSAGNYPLAQAEVAEALVLDPSCARARILEGRLQALSGNHLDAVGSWSSLVGDHPEMLCEVVHLVKSSSSALGSLSLFRGFLDRAIAATGDERLKLILVDHLAANGSEQEAEKVLLKLVNEAASLPALHRLLQFRELDTADSQISADYRLLRHVTGKSLSDRTGYECRFCGFQGRSLHWQCPGCRSWNTTSARPFSAILN
jgi:lipopolysaccharide biosynthesis regulator YciM